MPETDCFRHNLFLFPFDYTTLLIISKLKCIIAVEGMSSGDVFAILVLVDLQRLTSFSGVVCQFIFSRVSGTGIFSIPLNTLQWYELNSTFNHILTEKMNGEPAPTSTRRYPRCRDIQLYFNFQPFGIDPTQFLAQFADIWPFFIFVLA